jgi:hypothetical protein
VRRRQLGEPAVERLALVASASAAAAAALAAERVITAPSGTAHACMTQGALNLDLL